MRRTSWPLLVVGMGYACALAATNAFSDAADVVVAIPIAAFAVAVSVTWPASTREVRLPVDKGSYAPWMSLFVVTALWELFCYLAPGTRAEHPTFSSMTDAIDRYFPLKALMVLTWLSLGWMILRRGRKAGPTKRQATAP